MTRYSDAMAAAELEILSTALADSGGQVRAAAMFLGIPERTFWSRLTRLGVTRAELLAQKLQSDTKPA